MMRVNLIYAKFLAHLRSCPGCIGPRNNELCEYARVCAAAESMAKRGLVGNVEELLRYGERKESAQ